MVALLLHVRVGMVHVFGLLFIVTAPVALLLLLVDDVVDTVLVLVSCLVGGGVVIIMAPDALTAQPSLSVPTVLTVPIRTPKYRSDRACSMSGF